MNSINIPVSATKIPMDDASVAERRDYYHRLHQSPGHQLVVQFLEALERVQDLAYDYWTDHGFGCDCLFCQHNKVGASTV